MSRAEEAAAEALIAALGLTPHPEGGHYAEIFRDQAVDGAGRARSTAIYFLLKRGERSHWHRVDAAEAWHVYAGAPLELATFDGKALRHHRLGADIAAGEKPLHVVPAHVWQAARSLGAFTLAGCTVAPGFTF
jgi:predicted cupin superfamily sugar epimerase